MSQKLFYKSLSESRTLFGNELLNIARHSLFELGISCESRKALSDQVVAFQVSHFGKHFQNDVKTESQTTNKQAKFNIFNVSWSPSLFRTFRVDCCPRRSLRK
eukprot:Gregarina_sp_Poly_1__4933@NODE_2616_length_1913_cov_42_536295_g1622_i1_p3_GENE_NODE_2616_length_1913_cov_42_536295_g1622_i1NODE_2616_length_1913_cov_42_536295_g1622_i1_p3_ORF_typecomplete_len103_score8_13Orexin_rec2/PF03827_13/0_074_NODE_2616_length_1913_cov_42_536295_g1622_i1115423